VNWIIKTKKVRRLLLLQIWALCVGEMCMGLSSLPDPISISQGDTMALLVRIEEGKEINQVRLGTTSISFYLLTANIYQIILGVSSDEAVGETALHIEKKNQGVEDLKLTVQKTDFPRREIKLPKNHVAYTEKEIAQINADNEQIVAVASEHRETKFWDEPFVRPVPGAMVSPFGQRRIVDGEERSPHTGVDLHGAVGDLVHATNHGIVVLAETFFLPGNALLIDHGQGIFSMYFHLNEIKVKLGDRITKGQVIGEVGASGRATGPHLHFGMRMNNAKIDPLKLIALKFYQSDSPELARFKK
jgi:murein DD-endopeptidase MepM/ murein hydrolase activator NlpD